MVDDTVVHIVLLID